MTKTTSCMLPLGTPAALFSLTDSITGNVITLEQSKGTIATVICFICNHCPYVKHISTELARTAMDYQNSGIGFLAINANDAQQYPEDSVENMQKTANKLQYSFPYLFDETQEVAKAYQATCTPDFFIFDDQLKLVYRGQFDSSRPGNNIKVTGNSIRHTLDCLINHQEILTEQRPSLGCNIKWK